MEAEQHPGVHLSHLWYTRVYISQPCGIPGWCISLNPVVYPGGVSLSYTRWYTRVDDTLHTPWGIPGCITVYMSSYHCL